MRRFIVKAMLLGLLIMIAWMASWQSPAAASDLAQLPTGSVPTVTSTPGGPYAIVNSDSGEFQVKLRSGPGVLYDQVGLLLLGQKAPAKGRSPGNEWILVEYPGIPGGHAWVFSLYVTIDPPVQLPVVEPPPTPTLAMTATIDPTLAARWIVTTEPTRLPTFTAPPPLAIPTFTDEGSPSLSSVPMGFVILGLAVTGLFLGIMAMAQRG